MTREPLSLLPGTVDALILKALSWGPAHGYGVSRWIRDRTGGALHLDDAGLYQGLHRLERRGWIRAEWGLSENNRRARYYELTAAGRRRLVREVDDWRRYAQAVFRVLDARTATG